MSYQLTPISSYSAQEVQINFSLQKCASSEIKMDLSGHCLEYFRVQQDGINFLFALYIYSVNYKLILSINCVTNTTVSNNFFKITPKYGRYRIQNF